MSSCQGIKSRYVKLASELHWREQRLSHHSPPLPQILDCTATESHLDVEPTCTFNIFWKAVKWLVIYHEIDAVKSNIPALTNLQRTHCIRWGKYCSNRWTKSNTKLGYSEKFYVKITVKIHVDGLVTWCSKMMRWIMSNQDSHEESNQQIRT